MIITMIMKLRNMNVNENRITDFYYFRCDSIILLRCLAMNVSKESEQIKMK